MATNDWTERLTTDRLAAWARDLAYDHATPLLLVGVGHDRTRGRIVVCTVDDAEMTDDRLRAFLRYAINHLDEAHR